MSCKRLVSLAVSCVVFSLLGYLAFIPPKVTASNCCRFPTLETETAVEASSSYLTEEQFKMTLEDPQGTDFASDPSDGMVGETTPTPGTDGCYAEAKKLGHAPAFGAFDTVTTPYPTYHWVVGQVGYCDTNSSGECEDGPLNNVDPTSAYNQFGYDFVGWSDVYPDYAVNYYQKTVKGMTFPCMTSFKQVMAYYCTFTFYWRPYVTNTLTAKINPSYVVDCKNSVCSPDIDY